MRDQLKAPRDISVLIDTMRTLFVGFLFFTLVGCALITPPLEKPVIEQKTHNWIGTEKVSVFSSTASRRQMIVQMPGSIVCAEAPPDVAETILSSLALLIKRESGDGSNDEGQVNIQLDKTLSTTIDRLFDRTQGTQFFRDSAFHLCLALFNGAISNSEYKDQYNELVTVSAKLIESELNLTHPLPPELKKAIQLKSQAENLEIEAITIKGEADEILKKAEENIQSATEESIKEEANALKFKADSYVTAAGKAVELAKKAATTTRHIVEDAQMTIDLTLSKTIKEILPMDILDAAKKSLKNAQTALGEAKEVAP